MVDTLAIRDPPRARLHTTWGGRDTSKKKKKKKELFVI